MGERRSSGGLQQRPEHRRSSTYSGQGTPQMGSPVLDDDPSAEFLQERPSTRGKWLIIRMAGLTRVHELTTQQ